MKITQRNELYLELAAEALLRCRDKMNTLNVRGFALGSSEYKAHKDLAESELRYALLLIDSVKRS